MGSFEQYIVKYYEGRCAERGRAEEEGVGESKGGREGELTDHKAG